MKAIDWLEHELDHDGDPIYSLDKARARHEVRELCEGGYLILNRDRGDLWLRFAVMDFIHSDGDGRNQMLGCQFHGDGPSDNLRECRHTYWGDDGYLFYPNAKVIKAGLEALAEFYDFYD